MSCFIDWLRQQLAQATVAPRYIQLANSIEAAIRQKQLKAGEFLPAERVLAEQLYLSRVTISRALAVLEQKQLILRQQGVGTRVAVHIDYSLDSDDGFTLLVTQQGGKVSNQWLLRILEPATTDIAMLLQLKEHQPVAKLRRLRLMDGLPVSLETTYIPQHFLPEPQALEHSLYTLWQSYGIAPVHKRFLIKAIVCGAEIAPLLNVATGSPLLRISQTSCNACNEVMEWSETLCRSDVYEFVVNSQRNAMGSK